MSQRLMQRRDADGRRSVVFADGERAVILDGVASVRDLAWCAIVEGVGLAELAAASAGPEIDPVEELAQGRLLAPIDHEDPAHVVISGTGLTHLGSADSRDKMHKAASAAVTDSMRMFREGLEGGKPPPGVVGQQPEWFYKGDGSLLAAPGADLEMPDFAKDGGEEPELAGIYLIGPDGTPYRLGICLGNEFSDHVTERHNYLWLAHSKLRMAALGPELLLGAPPSNVKGASRILRNGVVLWEKPFLSGEENMSHSLENLERHHFKYRQFRRPGDVHIHFFGTATLSFADHIVTEPGDLFEIEAPPFTLPLRNRLSRAASEPVVVRAL